MEHLVPEQVCDVGKGARAEQWPWRRVCAGAMIRSPLYLLNECVTFLCRSCTRASFSKFLEKFLDLAEIEIAEKPFCVCVYPKSGTCRGLGEPLGVVLIPVVMPATFVTCH